MNLTKTLKIGGFCDFQLNPLCRGLGVAVSFGSFFSSVRENEHIPFAPFRKGEYSLPLINALILLNKLQKPFKRLNALSLQCPSVHNLPVMLHPRIQMSDFKIILAQIPLMSLHILHHLMVILQPPLVLRHLLFRLLSRQVAEIVEASMATISSCFVCCDIIATFISPALSPQSQRVLHTHFDCHKRCPSGYHPMAMFLLSWGSLPHPPHVNSSIIASQTSSDANFTPSLPPSHLPR